MIPKLLLVPLAVACSLTLLYLIVLNAPHGGGELSFPSSLEHIRVLATVLNTYNMSNPRYVLLLFSSSYLFKQTFAVPGSVFLNVLAGAIFGAGGGFLLCCVLTALGASFCYLLARAVGKEVALHYFPVRVEKFRVRLEENRQELPFFLLFLRLFPMSPNWALNMASGVLGVPLHLFFLSVFFGLMPYNYLCVTSGVILSEIREVGDILSWSNMARCATIAVAALLPTLLLRGRRQAKAEANECED
eukprot:GFUD01139299.1.p1 GENE.GFUD01139299.1~~GFUD01139299.1.p1  ORF type:complete len:246 (-),score=54.06 GFUD01139299.1:98-835(-)